MQFVVIFLATFVSYVSAETHNGGEGVAYSHFSMNNLKMFYTFRQSCQKPTKEPHNLETINVNRTGNFLKSVQKRDVMKVGPARVQPLSYQRNSRDWQSFSR